MIICANCSRENADHYKFCLGCGTELAGGAPSGGGSAKAGGVPKLGTVPKLGGAGKLKLGGGLFGKKGGLSGLGGLSGRLNPPKAEPEVQDVDFEEPEEATDDDPIDDAPEVDEIEAAPEGSAEEIEATEAMAIPEDDEDDFDVPPVAVDGDGFDGEIEAADADDDPFAGIQSDPPPDEPELLEDDVEDDFDDFEPLEAPVVARPARAVPEPTPAAAIPQAVPQAVPRAVPQAVPRPVAQATPHAPPPVEELDDIDDSLHEDALPTGRVCQACNAIVPDGFKFCGVCGSRYDAPVAPAATDERRPAAVQTAGAPSAHLVLIHPDGTEGEIFPLNAGETTVGRSNPSPIFSEDPFLSPRHATFYFVQGQLYVRDESSLNGVFLRIRAEVELFHWDMFRIGQQLLRFEEMSQVRPVMPGSGDGTTVMGSPVRGTWGRLASVVALDTTTSVWPLRKPEVYLGRERGEMCFPEDGFVSGSHCKVSMRRGRFFLGDLDSTNGTYLRIKGEGIVTRGDLLLLGQQLFKVQLNR